MTKNLLDRSNSARIAKRRISDAEKLVYIPIEVVIQAADEYLNAEIRTELSKRFGSYRGKTKLPVSVTNGLLDFICTHCLGHLPKQQAERLMGHKFMAQYRNSLVNQVVYMALRRASIEQIIKGLPRNFALTNNFGTYTAWEVAPKHWRLDLDDNPGSPYFIQGILESGAKTLNNDTCYRVTVEGSHKFYIDITWEIGRLPL